MLTHEHEHENVNALSLILLIKIYGCVFGFGMVMRRDRHIIYTAIMHFLP